MLLETFTQLKPRETLQKTVAELATESSCILLVGNEPSGWAKLRLIAESKAWLLESASSGLEALERLQSGARPGLVLLDLAQASEDGMYTLRWLRRVSPEVRVLVMGDDRDESQKREAMRLGAQGFLAGNGDGKELAEAVERYLDRSRNGAESDPSSDGIEEIGPNLFFVAASPAMRKLRVQAELLAQVDAPLLIVGETGSGRETSARLVHKVSVRSEFAFVRIDCSTLPSDLLETELFGSETGTNGSLHVKPGKLELYARGTILLAEIAEMSAELQGKLLDAIQNRYFIRQGGSEKIELNVRIMASTSPYTKDAMAEGRLREDLYYRLSGFSMYVPPVRQRRQEIPLLLAHFMSQLAKRYNLTARAFSPMVIELCQRYFWPGNLIELESFVKRFLVVGDDELAIRELERNINSRAGQRPQGQSREPVYRGSPAAMFPEDVSCGLKSFVENVKGEAEKNAIHSALEQTNWNRKAAARLLKVSYRTLLYKIQQYQMNPRKGYLYSVWLDERSKSHREPS